LKISKDLNYPSTYMDYAITTRDKKIQSQYKTIIQVYKARTIIPNLQIKLAWKFLLEDHPSSSSSSPPLGVYLAFKFSSPPQQYPLPRF